MNPRKVATKQPGKWNGRKWVCLNQPADNIKKYYYCCPSGWRSKRRDPKIRTSLKLRIEEATCPEGRGVQACGPNPGGDVKCCPRTHRWLPKSRECPMPKAARGYDVNFLNQLRLPRKQEVNIGKKLAIVGIPMALALIVIIFSVVGKLKYG